MDDLNRYIADRSQRDPDFQAEFEAEAAMLALVRARIQANLTQQEVAAALHVSQPYIAQVERGTRMPGYLFLFKYANAVGAKIEVGSANVSH